MVAIFDVEKFLFTEFVPNDGWQLVSIGELDLIA